MTDIIFPLSAGNVAQVVAERDNEIDRLREKVEILEAEIRVMRKLPSAVNAAVDAMLAAHGQSEEGGLYDCPHCGGELKDHKPDCPAIRATDKR